MKKKSIGWIVACAAALTVCAIAVFVALPEIEVVSPNCLEKGYTLYRQFGNTQIRDIVDALGHDYSDWNIDAESDGMAGGKRSRICKMCGYEDTDTFYEESDMARLFLVGDVAGISKYQQSMVRAELTAYGDTFEGYAIVKHQGHKTLQYEKKNYTVKFFSDEQCNEKHKFTFLDWNKEHKYILKANFADVSRSRNLIGSDLWSRMVEDRDNIHPRLAQTSNYGTTDGFPIELYINDVYSGVYILSLHKDEDLFEMDEGQKDGIVIINDNQTPSSTFRETVDWDKNQDWEIEFCGTQEDAWLKEKVNSFIQFVMESDDETFRKELCQYVDVDSFIDYLILLYTLGMPDHVAKDLVLASYDGGVFIANMYNMKEAFGLVADGSDFIYTEQCLPASKDGILASGTDSLLWDRLLENFTPQIRARYQQLREDVLSFDSIVNTITQRINAIPHMTNQADMELYGEQPQQDIFHQEQMEQFVSERLSFLDVFFQEEIINEN